MEGILSPHSTGHCAQFHRSSRLRWGRSGVDRPARTDRRRTARRILRPGHVHDADAPLCPQRTQAVGRSKSNRPPVSRAGQRGVDHPGQGRVAVMELVRGAGRVVRMAFVGSFAGSIDAERRWGALPVGDGTSPGRGRLVEGAWGRARVRSPPIRPLRPVGAWGARHGLGGADRAPPAPRDDPLAPPRQAHQALQRRTRFLACLRTEPAGMNPNRPEAAGSAQVRPARCARRHARRAGDLGRRRRIQRVAGRVARSGHEPLVIGQGGLSGPRRRHRAGGRDDAEARRGPRRSGEPAPRCAPLGGALGVGMVVHGMASLRTPARVLKEWSARSGSVRHGAECRAPYRAVGERPACA